MYKGSIIDRYTRCSSFFFCVAAWSYVHVHPQHTHTHTLHRYKRVKKDLIKVPTIQFYMLKDIYIYLPTYKIIYCRCSVENNQKIILVLDYRNIYSSRNMAEPLFSLWCVYRKFHACCWVFCLRGTQKVSMYMFMILTVFSHIIPDQTSRQEI